MNVLFYQVLEDFIESSIPGYVKWQTAATLSVKLKKTHLSWWNEEIEQVTKICAKHTELEEEKERSYYTIILGLWFFSLIFFKFKKLILNNASLNYTNTVWNNVRVFYFEIMLSMQYHQKKQTTITKYHFNVKFNNLWIWKDNIV